MSTNAHPARPVLAAVLVLLAAAPDRAPAGARDADGGEPLGRALVTRRMHASGLAAALDEAMPHVDPRILRGQLQALCPAVPLPAGGRSWYIEAARRRAAALRTCRPDTLARLATMSSPDLGRLITESLAAMTLSDGELSRLVSRVADREARRSADPSAEEDVEDEDEVEGLIVLGRHELVLVAVARLQHALWLASETEGSEDEDEAFDRLRRALQRMERRTCPAEPGAEPAPSRREGGAIPVHPLRGEGPPITLALAGPVTVRTYPKVILPEGFPSDLARQAQRIADIINGGDRAAIARIDATGGDLERFWSGYAPLGTIVFRAFRHEQSGGFVLHDATSGMFGCRVDCRGGSWKVTECEFNDGY